MHRNHQHFLEKLMLYERQQFLNAAPDQSHAWRIDRANSFYNRTEAIQRFRAWKARWGRSAERAVRCLSQQNLEELLAHFDCPRAHWKELRTTHVIERLFVEVRRCIRTMCAFTTSGSCEHILSACFTESTNTGANTLRKLLHKNP